jgi:hypothetical protein
MVVVAAGRSPETGRDVLATLERMVDVHTKQQVSSSTGSNPGCSSSGCLVSGFTTIVASCWWHTAGTAVPLIKEEMLQLAEVGGGRGWVWVGAQNDPLSHNEMGMVEGRSGSDGEEVPVCPITHEAIVTRESLKIVITR